MLTPAEQEFVTKHMRLRSKLDIVECLVISSAVNSEVEVTPELIMDLKVKYHAGMNEFMMSVR